MTATVELNYLSVASGIEAATVAWKPLGWHPIAFAQFDPEHKYKHGPDFASAVLAHHYGSNLPGEPLSGNAPPNLGNMTNFKEWPDYADVDVLVGGTPCQTYSVAGLGAGLDDPRGDLALTYAAIARRYRPTWVVWENVGGVLSNDQGRAFGSILGILSGQHVEVPAGGWRTAGIVPGIASAYGLAWRVLDTQYVRIDGFGRAIPQRRRRVFVVGYLGDWRRAAAVLFEREGLSGNPPPSRRPGQVASGSLTGSSGKRRGVDDGERGTLVAGTITARSAKSRGAGCVDDAALIPQVANPLTARMHKGVNTTMDEGQTMIPHPADVSPPILAGQNKTGGDRQPGMDVDSVHSLIPISFNTRQDPVNADDVSIPIDSDGTTTAIAFKASHFTRGKDGAPADVAFALSADADKGDQDMLVLAPDACDIGVPDVAATLTRGAESSGKGGYAGRRQEDDVNLVALPFDTTQITNPNNRSNPQPGDPSPTLAKGAHAPAIAFQPRFARNDRGAPIEEVAYPLTAEAGRTGKGDSAQVVAFQDRFRGDDGRGYDRPPAVAEDVCGTLETVKPWNVARKWSVRRLMPVECERLQGFVDGYTAIQYRGKPAADGPRYKVLGNSMSTNSMRWIGRRIQMVEEVIRNG